MKTLAEFFDFFGGDLPKFYGQGELTLDEMRRVEPLGGCIQVDFDVTEPFLGGYMCRSFRDKEAILDYMRKWGLGVTDIAVIYDRTPKYKTQWCVLAYDPFYGTAYSSEGYRRRWYFDTEAQADAFIDGGGLPQGLKLAEVYQVEKRVI